MIDTDHGPGAEGKLRVLKQAVTELTVDLTILPALSVLKSGLGLRAYDVRFKAIHGAWKKVNLPHKETLIVPYLLEGPPYQTFSRKQPDFLYQPGWWYRLAQVLRGRPQRYDWQG
ncbi:hypothetical protein Bbelb_441620 [Branchiostoma belcheri]|nr:hypothetical protein Bbelb_441620 [Branchiostoma belcheri]